MDKNLITETYAVVAASLNAEKTMDPDVRERVLGILLNILTAYGSLSQTYKIALERADFYEREMSKLNGIPVEGETIKPELDED